MKSSFALLALAAALPAGADGDLWLRRGEGTGDAGIEGAAAGIAARCRTYGLADIAAEVVPAGDAKLVRLSAPHGINDEVKRIVTALSAMAARKMEMRIVFVSIAEESKKLPIPPRDKPAGAKAPPGTRWYPQLTAPPAACGTLKDILLDPIALCDSPYIPASAFSRVKLEGKPVAAPLYEISAGAMAAFAKETSGRGTYIYIPVVDGYAIHAYVEDLTTTGGREWTVSCPSCNGTGRNLKPGATSSTPCRLCAGRGAVDLNAGRNRHIVSLKPGAGKALDAMLQNPMPFPLEVLSGEAATKAAADAAASAAAKPSPPPAPAATASPPAPSAAPAPAPPPPDDAERDCAKWLLLAKNFYNQREYAKAQELVDKVLAKCPQWSRAEEARELRKQIESVK